MKEIVRIDKGGIFPAWLNKSQAFDTKYLRETNFFRTSKELEKRVKLVEINNALMRKYNARRNREYDEQSIGNLQTFKLLGEEAIDKFMIFKVVQDERRNTFAVSPNSVHKVRPFLKLWR